MTETIPELEDDTPVPPPPVRPDNWSDKSWKKFLEEADETPPSSWRLEDGTIYSRDVPSWMHADKDLLVDSGITVKPGDPNYEFFEGVLNTFYDHYKER